MGVHTWMCTYMCIFMHLHKEVYFSVFLNFPLITCDTSIIGVHQISQSMGIIRPPCHEFPVFPGSFPTYSDLVAPENHQELPHVPNQLHDRSHPRCQVTSQHLYRDSAQQWFSQVPKLGSLETGNDGDSGFLWGTVWEGKLTFSLYGLLYLLKFYPCTYQHSFRDRNN